MAKALTGHVEVRKGRKIGGKGLGILAAGCSRNHCADWK